MICPDCKTRIRVTPATAPGEWARMSAILWGVSMTLAVFGFALSVWHSFVFAGVIALGAAYATLSTFTCRDWAMKFRDRTCSNCGREYDVGFWTVND